MRAARMASKKSKKSAKVTKVGIRRAAVKPALLAGGNPQVAKAEGDAPVQAYIKTMTGAWTR